MSQASFPWPTPSGCRKAPEWTGTAFRTEGRSERVLSFRTGHSGWTDDLTAFHEDAAGDNHPIDRASRRHALAQIGRHVEPEGATILEVGCSSGFFLKDLRSAMPGATVIGADYVRGPLEALGREIPDLPLMQFDLTKCPLPDACVDAVVLINVLEHIEDDNAAIAHVARVLRPGGVAVIEVPAAPHLFDVYDKLLLHFRRYRLGELRRQVEAAGLRVTHASHLGALVYPAFRFVKKRNRRYLDEPLEVQKAVVSKAIKKTSRSPVMEGVFRIESALRRILPLPFGIRCLVTCVKPVAAVRPLRLAA